MPQRVVLAMSGGVDSSVAAHLLKADGYDVVGLFMRTGSHGESEERRSKTCCSVADALDARRVADRLEIPFFVLDFEREFGRIQDYFADEYFAGRTPNPCVMCNIWLKFGRLWDYAKQVGADFVATGHYARIARAADGSTRVGRGLDRDKDQSYVLSGLAPELLESILFPIGQFAKAEVRALAKGRDLPVHDKAESQEICFVPDDDYLEFVRRRRPEQETSGTLVDEDGAVLGEHSGIEKFTIGQRRGLGVALGAPRYVVQIEPTSRTVTVGRKESLARPGLEASRFNWQGPTPDGPASCLAQIRARHHAVPAVVEPLADGRVRVRFEVPQPAVAPGQVVTLYQDDLVLGGGWIERALAE
ncbi:tRNA 2-thiouridine(34) synthase MnmA [Paludisphaera mucosa]|uniref:tRNA-specific 2-thiouridylase MnmA n=1 Tax=Paludisphaera mucosa TaxID=3030827 RepID=A0ABT6FF85_9BACT|nr:tRNA 2-thiouridine(34) synthase MnmA [Paludisphaera mucosa]MDG3006231.1 tRNA 2-thiouridine(34) synthase MnmA [Paludisphaera mucosa]